jgi:hypothetical protein
LKTLFCTYFLLIWIAASAQDSSAKKLSFSHEVIFWEKWQMHKMFAKVNMPSELKENRNQFFTIPGSNDTITDNPLLHGATYVALKTRTGFSNKIFLYADLYAEQRGCSYGLFNTKNSIIYPVMRLEAFDTIKLEKNPIALKARLGEFPDEQLDEGLIVYNMDEQGVQLSAQQRSLIFTFTIYGDLCNGIGLDIDDLYSFTLKKQFIKLNAAIGASMVIAKPPLTQVKNNYNLNLFARKNFTDAVFFCQAGFRPFKIQIDDARTSHNFAFVSGVEVNKPHKKISLNLKAEARYYGNMFNIGYYDGSRLLYREPARDIYENYANTVGAFLYPLRKFDTPFSQWAVLTEFREYNIAMVTVEAKPVIKLNSRFEMFTDLDINYITGTKDKFWDELNVNRSVKFVYPFFDAGIGYHPVENTIAKISITNKAMNLDVAYSTHYLLKKPCLQLSMFATF